MKTARLASATASINGWIAFAATILITFIVDKHYLLKFIVGSFENRNYFIGFLYFLLMVFVFVVIAVIVDIVAAIVQLPIGYAIMYFDDEIRQEAANAGVSYGSMCLDIFKRNMKDLLAESFMRILCFWESAPVAIITHLVCGFLIIKLGW